MNQPTFGYLFSLALLCILICSCNQKNEKLYNHPKGVGYSNDAYVKGIMSHYPNIFPKDTSHISLMLPGPPAGLFYYTIDVTYKADTFSILLSSLSELVKLSKISQQPIDSISLATIIKRETLIQLTEKEFEKAIIVEPIASIDSIKIKGRDYFLNYYFTSSGTQKTRITHKEEIYIIDVLSNWSLPVDFDDYVGLYRYRKLD